jgi:hypothetical protein
MCLVVLALASAGACRREEQPPSPAGSASPEAATPGPPESRDVASPFDPERPPNRLAPPKERILSGEWGTKDDYRMRVVTVSECAVESYFAPKEGHIKLGIEVELVGTSDKEVPSSPLHAALLDGDGARYEATLAGCRPSLPPKRVKQDETARGFVTFEIPKAARGLVLRYEPFVVGRAETDLAFDLGR